MRLHIFFMGYNIHLESAEQFVQPQNHDSRGNILCLPALSYAWNLVHVLEKSTKQPKTLKFNCHHSKFSEWIYIFFLPHNAALLVMDMLPPLAMTSYWCAWLWEAIAAKPIRINECWKMPSITEMPCAL